jgi:GT2 family glycosyltransferase
LTPKLLLAITVYNGPEVVPSCLRSAARIAGDSCAVETLVLDDASPLPGFSDQLRVLCRDLGIQYYRSPRNLGIPRNVNLGLLRALRGGYDYVIIANSDVIFSRRAVTQLVKVCSGDASIGSVTAWSNNASIYSLQNAEPDRYLSDQDVVDWIADELRAEFGDAAVDIPAGISFCICISTPALRRVGLMDPVFGRGYSEETDWTLRSRSLGYRIVLAPSAFVYHRGGGSNIAAGLVGYGQGAVPSNERIVDMRYPTFRSEVVAYQSSGTPETLTRRALRRITLEGARQHGYEVTVGHIRDPEAGTYFARVSIEKVEDRLHAFVQFRGFTAELDLGTDDPISSVIDQVGTEPTAIRLFDRRILGWREGAATDSPRVTDEVGYPPRV